MVSPRGSMHGCSGGHAWDMTRYADTVNERAVHILLECILVFCILVSCLKVLTRMMRGRCLGYLLFLKV